MNKNHPLSHPTPPPSVTITLGHPLSQDHSATLYPGPLGHPLPWSTLPPSTTITRSSSVADRPVTLCPRPPGYLLTQTHAATLYRGPLGHPKYPRPGRRCSIHVRVTPKTRSIIPLHKSYEQTSSLITQKDPSVELRTETENTTLHSFPQVKGSRVQRRRQFVPRSGVS